jgi:hypothetical protein
VSSDDVPNAAQRLKLQNDVRTTGVQLLGGVVLALGAFLTARTIRVIREGQITERFTRAIDHLGSGELDVRLGGIYALERIARDSRRVRPLYGNEELLARFAQLRFCKEARLFDLASWTACCGAPYGGRGDKPNSDPRLE